MNAERDAFMEDGKFTGILNSLFTLTRISIWKLENPEEIFCSGTDFNADFVPDFSAPLFTDGLLSCQKEERPFFLTGPACETYACVFWPARQLSFILGPVWCGSLQDIPDCNPLCFPGLSPAGRKQFFRQIPPVSFHKFCHFTFLFCCSLGISCEDTEALYAAQERSRENFSDMDFRSFLYNQREKIVHHNGYDRELLFLNYVKRGDCENLKSILDALVQQYSPSTLSDNDKEQALFNLIACTTLVTRYAIEGGLDQSLAYNLSDYYIRKAKKCTNTGDTKALLFSMSMDFSTRVASVRQSRNFSYPVAAACEYIFSNLHYNISLRDMAASLNRSEGYLSTVFKKETGMTVMEFIRRERLKEACSLLCHTAKSCQEIASSLSFSSQSYFSKLFRREYGMTPLEYRASHKS